MRIIDKILGKKEPEEAERDVKVIDNKDKTKGEFWHEVAQTMKRDLAEIRKNEETVVKKEPYFAFGKVNFPRKEANYEGTPVTFGPSQICLQCINKLELEERIKIYKTEGEGGSYKLEDKSTKEFIKPVILELIDKLIEDGFIWEHLNYGSWEVKNNPQKQDLKFDPKISETLYLKHKDDKGFHDSKIYKWITARYWHATLEINGHWEHLPYFRNELLPIIKKYPHWFVELDACAPPDYSKEPLYYPLISMVYYPDGSIEDNTVYCNWNGEYLPEKGLKNEVLERKFEDWDRWKLPWFNKRVSKGYGSIDFPRLSISIPGITAAMPPRSSIRVKCFYREMEERNVVYDRLIERISEDKKYSIDLVYPKNNRIHVEHIIEGYEKSVSINIMNYKRGKEMDDDEKHQEECDLYGVSIGEVAKWDSDLFLYLLEMSDFVQKYPYEHIEFTASARKTKSGYYPLIRFVWFNDGTFLNLTHYCSMEGKYSYKRGFDANEILSKKHIKIFNKIINGENKIQLIKNYENDEQKIIRR